MHACQMAAPQGPRGRHAGCGAKPCESMPKAAQKIASP